MAILFIAAPATSAETCGVFHQKIDDKCIKFDVPSNAHITYSGNNWECNRGFKRGEDNISCVEIKIPANATANWIGSFYCNSGYQRVGDECIRSEPVENSRFYEFEADFYCLSGYLKNEQSGKCEKIVVPENGRQDPSSLDGWSCNREFIQEGGECKKFTLPEKAFWSGNIWKCEQGFRKNPTNKSCEKIPIPENAHSADTYDGWLCNSGYTKNYKENRCEK